ncbi:MAG: hypothetical protein WBZ23_19695, partial [Pseudolabrys sp.]
EEHIHPTESDLKRGGRSMASEGSKAKRILQVKIRIPSADTTSLLTATMKNALSVYGAFGDAQVRLLRNADDRTQFLQVIEYQMDQTIEFNRQKFASDPMMQNYLQAWRTLFPGTIEIDVYEDITESA